MIATLGLRLYANAGDAIACDIYPLPVGRDAAEVEIRRVLAEDVRSRVRLSHDEVNLYVDRHAAKAMHDYDRAVEIGMNNGSIVYITDAMPLRSHCIQREDGAVVEVVL